MPCADVEEGGGKESFEQVARCKVGCFIVDTLVSPQHAKSVFSSPLMAVCAHASLCSRMFTSIFGVALYILLRKSGLSCSLYAIAVL